MRYNFGSVNDFTNIKVIEVIKGVYVPLSFCKLDIKDMSVFEAKINKFLLWNLLGQVDLPNMLGDDFGKLAIKYNEFSKSNKVGLEDTTDDIINHVHIDKKYSSDVSNMLQIVGYVNMKYKKNQLNDVFINYFKSQGIEVNDEKEQD